MCMHIIWCNFYIPSDINLLFNTLNFLIIVTIVDEM